MSRKRPELQQGKAQKSCWGLLHCSVDFGIRALGVRRPVHSPSASWRALASPGSSNAWAPWSRGRERRYDCDLQVSGDPTRDLDVILDRQNISGRGGTELTTSKSLRMPMDACGCLGRSGTLEPNSPPDPHHRVSGKGCCRVS